MVSTKTLKKFSKLKKWLLDNGAKFPHIDITHYSDIFRGVTTTKLIKKNDVVVQIPYKCIMTVQKAKLSEVGKEILKNNFVPESEHTWIALFLLNEKLKQDSFWKPYIDTLPIHYHNFPLFFGKKTTLKKVKSSLIFDMIKARKYELQMDFDKIKQGIPIFAEKITFQDYVWARIAVISRMFGSDSNDSGLVPLSDMLNHAEDPGTTWQYNSERQYFEIRSTKYFGKNMEIFDTYGGKCNSRYFVNYGFTLQNNQKYNTAVFFFPIKDILDTFDKSNQEFKNKKLDYFKKQFMLNFDDGYSGYSLLIREKKEDKVSSNKYARFQISTLLPKKDPESLKSHVQAWSMLSFLRLLLCTPEEWKQVDTKNPIHFVLQDMKPFSIETEVKVLTVLKLHCEEKLKAFSEVKENKCEPFSTQWNICNMLSSEKEIYKFYYNLSNCILDLYSKSSSNHISFRNHKSLKTLCKTYMSTIWTQTLNYHS